METDQFESAAWLCMVGCVCLSLFGVVQGPNAQPEIAAEMIAVATRI